MKRNENYSDSSDAEMQVDNEEKEDIEQADSDDDSENEDENNELDTEPEFGKGRANGTVDPFMDSFYGLSSADPMERTQAAHIMLHHCLLGPAANSKDAAYALKRLLNGLCSGRAASRQGMASALASFLKLSFKLGRMDEIRKQNESPDESDLSHQAFIRKRLTTATEVRDDPMGGRKKGSEERDCQFGRLFGINAIIKSGILLPDNNVSSELDGIVRVSCAFARDLVELYNTKVWMREPAAHAITTLLNSYYNVCPKNSDARTVVQHIVDDVVVPDFLSVNENGGNMLFSSFSAEQIAVTIHVQSNLHHFQNAEISPSINKPILTKEVIKSIAGTLSETSSVAQPRTHLVWDTILAYITESDIDSIVSKVELRKTRKSCPLGADSVDDIIGALIQDVVIEKLLGIEDLDEHGRATTKSTNERSALALSLFRNMAGVEYLSSLAGRTKIILDSQILESTLLSPLLIRKLFLDIIGAGTKDRKGQGAHNLRPLSLQVLESSVGTSFEATNSRTREELQNLRLAIATAFARCDPRFDAKTKTSTVAKLLGIDGSGIVDESQISILDKFVSFAEDSIVVAFEKNTSDAILPHEATGYIDLVFHIAQCLLRSDSPTNINTLSETKRQLLEKIVRLFMICAFFDCKSIDHEISATDKKKKKKRKNSIDHNPVIEHALKIKTARSHLTKSTLPYQVRTVLSARFFSLIGAYVGYLSRSSNSEKDTGILKLVVDLNSTCQQLEKAGAVRIACISVNDQMDEGDEKPQDILVKLLKASESSSDQSKGQNAIHNLSERFALMASTLYLHLLRCGRIESESDELDIEEDEDEDEEEILSILNDVNQVYTLFVNGQQSGENPLRAHTELCANILSSNLGRGNQSRGGSPSLIRDIVKMTWTAGLSFAGASKQGFIFDSNIVNVLLNSIGALGDDSQSDNNNDSDDESSEGGDDSADEGSDREDSELPDANQLEDRNNADDESKDDEVELNPNGLQSMLEEDSDAEIDGADLEHHEGADAALARLIQAKKDARKAGQQALERAEISRQMRCILLLDTLVVGKPDTWGPLLRVDTILQLALPIIKYRRELLKSISSGNERGPSTGQTAKQTLIERLNSLLKSKVLKAKVSNNLWTASIEIEKFCNDQFTALVQEIKACPDKDQLALCNGLMMFLVRSIPDSDIQVGVAQRFSELVTAWSEKRFKGLDASFFESMIIHNLVISRVCLTQSLAKSTAHAKTVYLRSESFRLLSLVYNAKPNQTESGLDKLSLSCLADATSVIVEGFSAALKDSEMTKTKRIREVLKAVERILTSEGVGRVKSATLKEVIDQLQQLKENSESAGITQSIGKVITALEKLSEVKNKENTSDTPMAPNDDNNNEQQSDEEDNDADDVKNSSTKAKKSGKAKKKKKGKKKK